MHLSIISVFRVLNWSLVSWEQVILWCEVFRDGMLLLSWSDLYVIWNIVHVVSKDFSSWGTLDIVLSGVIDSFWYLVLINVSRLNHILSKLVVTHHSCILCNWNSCSLWWYFRWLNSTMCLLTNPRCLSSLRASWTRRNLTANLARVMILQLKMLRVLLKLRGLIIVPENIGEVLTGCSLFSIHSSGYHVLTLVRDGYNRFLLASKVLYMKWISLLFWLYLVILLPVSFLPYFLKRFLLQFLIYSSCNVGRVSSQDLSTTIGSWKIPSHFFGLGFELGSVDVFGIHEAVSPVTYLLLMIAEMDSTHKFFFLSILNLN